VIFYKKFRDAIRTLANEILQTSEMQATKYSKYLKDIQKRIDKLPDEIKVADKRKMETLKKIINEIEEENNKFIEIRNELLFNYEKKKEEDDDEIEEIEEENSNNENNSSIGNNLVVKKKKQIPKKEKGRIERLIDFLYWLFPLYGNITYLKFNFNSTIYTLFESMRFLFLSACGTCLIYIILIFNHLIKGKKYKGNDKCKYGIPCHWLFSSYDINEFNKYSVSYGVWIFVYFTLSFIFYCVMYSRNYQENIYRNNNRYETISAHLFNSWNFQVNKKERAEFDADDIYSDLREAKNEILTKYTNKYKGYKCRHKCYFFWANFIAAIICVIFLLILAFSFNIRNTLRTTNKFIKKNAMNDNIADMIFYLIVIGSFYFFPYLMALTVKLEPYKKREDAYLVKTLKKIIAVVLGFIVFYLIEVFSTLYAPEKKTADDKLKNLNSFYNCPGKYSNKTDDNSFTFVESNYDKIPGTEYASCREDAFAVNYFFLLITYVLMYFLIQGIQYLSIKVCGKCIKKKYIEFDPIYTFVHMFIVFVLFSFNIIFMPIMAFPFPFVMFGLFKYEYYKLKIFANCKFDETSIKNLSNSRKILNYFLIFTLLTLLGITYLYASKLPHYSMMQCYKSKGTDGETIMYSDKKVMCGPTFYNSRISFGMSFKMRSAFFFGWIYRLAREAISIMILLSIIFVIFIYRKYTPTKDYYDFIIRKQKEILETFQLLYQQISKRDLITKNLLLVVKNEQKED